MFLSNSLLSLWCLWCGLHVDAFSGLSVRASSDNGSRSRRPFSLSSIRQAATLPVANEVEFDEQDDETTKNLKDHLELDREGCLRIHKDGPVLLNGLDPSVWTAIKPTSGEDKSLFLHTIHSKEKHEHEVPLGDLVSCHRLLACSRLTRYWMGPAFGTSSKDVPFDTQFLLVEISESEPYQYALLLPLVDSGFRASLHYSSKSIEVVCHTESGDANVVSSGMRALYVAVGDDPFALLKKGFAQVSEATGTFSTLDQKQLPQSVNDFGWCTWDAFYSKVTPEGVIKGVESLREAGVPPKTLILDDGWQQVKPSPPGWESSSVNGVKPNSIFSRIGNAIKNAMLTPFVKAVEGFYEKFVRKASHGSIGNKIWRFLTKTILKGQMWEYFDKETDFGRQLSGFTPNYKFQEGEHKDVKSLKDLVAVLKTQLGIKQVYCWHALHGYWLGISRSAGMNIGINVTKVHPSPSNHLLRLEPQVAWDTACLFGVGLLTSASDLATFYRHIHTPLVESGVDGVKVDVQSGVSAVGGGVGGGPHIARLYTEAMETSVKEHFSSENGAVDTINCMCHSTENLYRYKVTSVARASEDFFPRRPETHTVHLVNVAYNSLFLGEICLPDWDMFHSQNEAAQLHAAARAIGGCPVYVSDEPGKHDVDLLRKLVLPDGSVLRAQLPGRPTRDCLFADVGADGTSALKIWNQNSCGGVVGAFHVQGVVWNFDTHENEVVDPSPRPLTAAVKPHDVESLRDISGPFVVWHHRTSALEILPSGESSVAAPLCHREWEIFTIVPVQTSGDVSWAPIGLGDMFNSGGAVLQAGQLEEDTTLGKNGLTTTTAGFVSRGPGRFVAYCQPAPSRVLVDGTPVMDVAFSHDEKSGKLSFILPDETSDGVAHQVTVAWDR